MQTYKITSNYKSGCLTIILPTAITLLTWAIVLFVPIIIMNWNIPQWLGILLFFGGFVVGLIVAVLTYKWIIRLDKGKKVELIFENHCLHWKKGIKTHKINFKKPHKIFIATGFINESELNVTITFYPQLNMIHFRNIKINDLIQNFPEPEFLNQPAIMPESGSWGFDISVNNSETLKFFIALIQSIWENRQKNELFLIYQKFPWSHIPEPDFNYILHIPGDKITENDKNFLKNLENQYIDNLQNSSVRATPNYLVGWKYSSISSVIINSVDYYIMPLGYLRAHTSIADDYTALIINGISKDGTSLKLSFDWYDKFSKEYDEANFLVHFIYTMYLKKQSSLNKSSY